MNFCQVGHSSLPQATLLVKIVKRLWGIDTFKKLSYTSIYIIIEVDNGLLKVFREGVNEFNILEEGLYV